ncbi:MAG: hypothetical protein ACI3ZY_08170 [Parabacteroides sp.]
MPKDTKSLGNKKPQLVKVGALCVKNEGVLFDTPSFLYQDQAFYDLLA